MDDQADQTNVGAEEDEEQCKGGRADQTDKHMAGSGAHGVEWRGKTSVRRRARTAPEERRRGDQDRGPPPPSRTTTSRGYTSLHSNNLKFFWLST
ncbi:hypothetical protein QQF64_035478 [Cirrhinus molitorella]|uniref:Uncharacterized protein n=1 Tax=Cirrhinus molitorella TaxID=172907 RepID=A0ABR3NFX9_9TELE